MKTYVCDIVDSKGDVYCAYVNAVDWPAAQKIAARRGWKILGQLIESVECPADIEAMIEKSMTRPVIH